MYIVLNYQFICCYCHCCRAVRNVIKIRECTTFEKWQQENAPNEIDLAFLVHWNDEIGSCRIEKINAHVQALFHLSHILTLFFPHRTEFWLFFFYFLRHFIQCQFQIKIFSLIWKVFTFPKSDTLKWKLYLSLIVTFTNFVQYN